MNLKNTNPLSLVAVLVSLGALGLTLSNNQQPQPSNEIPVHTMSQQNSEFAADRLQQLQQEINQLRNVIGDTHQLLAQLQKQQKKFALQLDSSSDQRTEDEVYSDEQALTASPGKQPVNSEAVRRREQHINYLDDKLYDEPVDIQWSSSISDKINETLTGLPAVQADTSFVECRSTLCMVELTVGEDDAEELLMGFNAQMTGSTNQMRSFVSNRGDGKLTMQMYLAKAGFMLPEFNPSSATP